MTKDRKEGDPTKVLVSEYSIRSRVSTEDLFDLDVVFTVLTIYVKNQVQEENVTLVKTKTNKVKLDHNPLT